MSEGGLVSDEIVVGIIKDRIAQQLVKHFRLLHSPRKTIKDKSFTAIWLCNTIFYNTNNNFIADEAALAHDLFCFQANLCTFCNGLTKHVTCRQSWRVHTSFNLWTMRAFPRTWRPEQHQDLAAIS